MKKEKADDIVENSWFNAGKKNIPNAIRREKK